MKKVIVFRHGKQEDLGLGLTSWAIPAHLTEQGKELAREVARCHKDLLEKCTFFFTSPLIRAQETLFEIMETLGHSVSSLDQKVQFNRGLWTLTPESWASNDPNETVATLWKKHPFLPLEEGRRLLGVIKEIAIVIPDNESVLCISHGGPLDAGLASAKLSLEGKAFSKHQDLRKGEGIIFCFDEENQLVKVEELRLPS